MGQDHQDRRGRTPSLSHPPPISHPPGRPTSWHCSSVSRTRRSCLRPPLSGPAWPGRAGVARCRRECRHRRIFDDRHGRAQALIRVTAPGAAQRTHELDDISSATCPYPNPPHHHHGRDAEVRGCSFFSRWESGRSKSSPPLSSHPTPVNGERAGAAWPRAGPAGQHAAGRRSCRSTRGSRGPAGRPGRTRRWCSCGGRGSAPTSSPDVTGGVHPRAVSGRRQGRRVGRELAARLDAFLDGRTMTSARRERARQHPNRLRYAAPTGRVLIRWDGARRPTIWTVPPPAVDPGDARLELARRYLHVFGPTTADGVRRVGRDRGRRAVGPRSTRSAGSLTPVRTPVGEAWILTEDEETFRAAGGEVASARLLPSGDAYFLLQGADRELLVPDPDRRRELWTPAGLAGRGLVEGEMAGTWRRAEADVTIESGDVSRGGAPAVELEAASLPLPGLRDGVRVRWDVQEWWAILDSNQ